MQKGITVIQILPNGLAMRFVNSVDINALEDLPISRLSDTH